MAIDNGVEYASDPHLSGLVDMWLNWDRNATTRAEVEQLVSDKQWVTLSSRLKDRLTFGTAGLRGRMCAGFNCMNDLVIVQTAQGLCAYMEQQFPSSSDRRERGIVLGYDGRYNSKRFAELTACIFLQRDFKVLLYSEMVATPFVPFAISKLKCLAGVMVTASHNPKEDNGYKVYWSNGAQIIPPHDKGIQQSIMQHLEPRETSWNTDVLLNCPLLVDPYEKVFAAYYQEMLLQIPQQILEMNADSNVRFVYTAMHGVGYVFVEEAFRAAKLKPVLAVEEQKMADPEFPTVKFPNPEEGKSALALSMKKAEAEGVSIILANDPDADRLACAEKDPKTGAWKVFNGNEIGALLGWWAFKVYKMLHPDADLSKCVMLASTVSSKILRSMGQIDGYKFEETLTGFKWMGNRATNLMNDGKKVLFAFEEAIGFMFTTTVLDKDGVSAACHLASMACYLCATEDITLGEKLNQIYDRYGYHCTNCSYLFCYDQDVIKRIFGRLRTYQDNKPDTYPLSILNGEFAIKFVRDLTTGVDTEQPDGRARLPVSSSSQMITFTFENGLVVTLRTSGTEPKIKYYAELCAQPDEKDWKHLRNKLDRMVTAIVDEFLQPDVNNLTPKGE